MPLVLDGATPLSLTEDDGYQDVVDYLSRREECIAVRRTKGN